MLGHDDDAGVEVLLRVLDIGEAGAFDGNHVPDGDFGSIGFEDMGAEGEGDEVAEDEEIRDFGGGNEAHQVEIEIARAQVQPGIHAVLRGSGC